MTYYHSKYFAHFLTLQNPNNSVERLGNSMFNATIDLNPHQVDGALFFFENPLSHGVILADEVGLWKTIEAGLVISQLWSEHKRKILLIVPASLRKQWSSELDEKFHLPSIILDNKTYKDYEREALEPFNPSPPKIIVASYEFIAKRWSEVMIQPWDLIVVDEAHKLRNVYRTDNKRANEIKNTIGNYKKLLLTATPLQNSLLELYGLVSFIDENTFGDLTSFKDQFIGDKVDFDDLKARIKPLVHRTLRKQVLEYISYTRRIPITQKFAPSEDEQKLYTYVSDFLQRDDLKSINNSQKTLITLIFRKLLASSTRAIAGTLDTMITRLETSHDFSQLVDIADEDLVAQIQEDYGEETTEQNEVLKATLLHLKEEIEELKKFKKLAYSINIDEKTKSLLVALNTAFVDLSKLHANKKAIIFTESRRTQDYLKEYLEENGYKWKVVLFNGTNKNSESKAIYENWLTRHRNSSKISGSKDSDMRASLVEYFKEDENCEIMLATESAAEGVNLQFCSLLINYDLPWNPQRIEQRIGRCHRYGQKFDVLVVNFLNTKNLADQRVFQLLNEKFQLFEWVFGASDEVLGSIEDGKDFEKRILEIYQTCRTDTEIQEAFDKLQSDYSESITQRLWETKKKVLDNFDEDVARNLKIKKEQSTLRLDIFKDYFWKLTKIELIDQVIFDTGDTYSFVLQEPLSAYVKKGRYNLVPNTDNIGYTYRTNEGLGEYIISQAKVRKLPTATIVFDYSKNDNKIAILEQYIWSMGYLQIDMLQLQSFDKEEYLIISGLDAKGNEIDQEILQKLFSLSGEVHEDPEISDEVLNQLETLKSNKIAVVSNQALERNNVYFDNTIEKLNKWAEDKKHSLDTQLKDIKKEIATKKTESRKITDLQAKIDIQRDIKNLESKQKELRRTLFEAEDEIEIEKEKLINSLQARLKGWSEMSHLFRIKRKII